jgi:hypothetical protein
MIELKQMDYHRNGVTGERFQVAIVHDPDIGQDMLVIHFPEYDDQGERTRGRNVRTAVLSLDVLRSDDPTIAFMFNSWRPETFHDAMFKWRDETRECDKRLETKPERGNQ